MDRIVAYLKDPAWWFSAFLVAILASLAAGFLKDYLVTRRERMAAEREAIIEALSSNESYLIMSLIRAGTLIIIYVLVFIAFFMVSIAYNSAMMLCALALIRLPLPLQECLAIAPWFWLLAPVLGMVAVLTGLLGVPYITRVAQGYKRYRRKRGLPVIR